MDRDTLVDQGDVGERCDKEVEQGDMLGDNLLLLFPVLCILRGDTEIVRRHFLPEDRTRLGGDDVRVRGDDRVLCDYFYADETVYQVLPDHAYITYGHVLSVLSVCSIWVEAKLLHDRLYGQFGDVH